MYSSSAIPFGVVVGCEVFELFLFIIFFNFSFSTLSLIHISSAARGVLEAIHWKPAIRWVVDRIHAVSYTHLDVYKRQGLHSMDKLLAEFLRILWQGIMPVFLITAA